MGRPRVILLRMVVVGVALATTVVVATNSGAESGPTPEELLGVLASPQTDTDRLPGYLASGFGESGRVFEQSSVHRLFVSSDQRHWVAIDERGWLCHIIQYLAATEGHLAMAGCAPGKEFVQSGISSTLETGEEGIRAALVPDGFLESMKPQIEAQYPTGNLVIFPPDGSHSGERIELEASDGRILLLSVPPAPGS